MVKAIEKFDLPYNYYKDQDFVSNPSGMLGGFDAEPNWDQHLCARFKTDPKWQIDNLMSSLLIIGCLICSFIHPKIYLAAPLKGFSSSQLLLSWSYPKLLWPTSTARWWSYGSFRET